MSFFEDMANFVTNAVQEVAQLPNTVLQAATNVQAKVAIGDPGDLMEHGLSRARKHEFEDRWDAFCHLRSSMMSKPDGTLFFGGVAFYPLNRKMWHIFVVVKFDGTLYTYDLDGAEGDDWKEGPGEYRFEHGFQDLTWEDYKHEATHDWKKYRLNIAALFRTEKSKAQVKDIAEKFKNDYPNYHYTDRNCMDFAIHMVKKLGNDPDRVPHAVKDLTEQLLDFDATGDNPLDAASGVASLVITIAMYIEATKALSWEYKGTSSTYGNSNLSEFWAMYPSQLNFAGD